MYSREELSIHLSLLIPHSARSHNGATAYQDDYSEIGYYSHRVCYAGTEQAIFKISHILLCYR